MTNNIRISRVQATLRRFEADIPLLNMRVKELSAERQDSARRFAAALIDETRAELARLLQDQSRYQSKDQPEDLPQAGQTPCEAAD